MIDLGSATNLLRGLRREVHALDDLTGYAVQFRDIKYMISNAELESYIDQKQFFKRPTETQLHHDGFYEHAVQFEGSIMRRPYGYRRGDDTLLLESNDGVTTIDIGRPSTMFCLSLTDTDDMGKDLRRLSLNGPVYRDTDTKHISDIFRINTIKIKTDKDSQLGKSITKLHDLAEAAIFHFAYGKGIPIAFTKTWERTYYWVGRRANETVQFPLRTYNSELVSYYNLAIASDSLILSYLALYKILEYFYTHVSETSLHGKLKEHLVAPDFAHTKTKKLRELVKIVRQFDSRLDEVGALQLVLSSYFEKSELRAWIENYERINGEYFTTENEIMNSTSRIDTSDNTIISNIAKRIYMIRNALVHNKEGEIARFIPYSGQEETLHKEVQILIFIAEQLIIKSGKDISV